MSHLEVVDNTSYRLAQESTSALSGADFYLNEEEIRNFVFDRISSSGKGINFAIVDKVQERLRALADYEVDYYDRITGLEHYAEQYHRALDVNPRNLSQSERSAQATSILFLSNVEALSALRGFIVDRFWSPGKVAPDDPAKMKYLEKRKIYQEDVDSYYDYFNGDLSSDELDRTLVDIANTARLLVTKRDWVGAITASNTHEFVGSVLSERVVKQSLRDHGFPQTRYGTAEEDASPTRADIVVPLEGSVLHLQVKMKWLEPTEFMTQPDRNPMGVVVPMHVIRGALTKPESRKLMRSATQKIEQLAA